MESVVKNKAIKVSWVFWTVLGVLFLLISLTSALVTNSFRTGLQERAAAQRAKTILRAITTTLHNDLLNSNIFMAGDRIRSLIEDPEREAPLAVRILDQAGNEVVSVDDGRLFPSKAARTLQEDIFFDVSKQQRAYQVQVAYLPGRFGYQSFGDVVLLSAVILLMSVAGFFILYLTARNLISKAMAVVSGKSRDVSAFRSFEIVELRQILATVDELDEARLAARTAEKIHRIATRLAHDIRSPLAALSVVMSDVEGMSESQRVLMSEAVRRIKEIANDLLRQEKGNVSESAARPRKVHIATTLERTLAEKKAQHRAKSEVSIEGRPSKDSYGAFVYCQPTEIERTLSNLINNSVEAMPESGGRVEIIMERQPKNAVLRIRDNGRGMPPEILAKIGQKGLTFGKSAALESGSGLGLYHAIQSIKAVGGTLKVQSEMGKGTEISITLPLCEPPLWFVEAITFAPKSHVLVLDDDASVHQVWETRFATFRSQGLTLHHVYNPEEFEAKLTELQTQPLLCLMDYSLAGFPATGLDLIEKHTLQSKAVLVTSLSDDEAVIARCERLRVKLLAKEMAGFVQLRLT